MQYANGPGGSTASNAAGKGWHFTAFGTGNRLGAVSGSGYRFGKPAVETPVCVWSLNGSRKHYQAISFNDETQTGVSAAGASTPKWR